MDELLILLLKKGAHNRPVLISTTDIGAALGLSQQSASRLLILLEKEQKISRDRNHIQLTKKGFDELTKDYIHLKQAFEPQALVLHGIITSGLGEGRYYISLPGFRKQFYEKLGFDPFLGTLNVTIDQKEVEKRVLVREREPMVIKGWKEKDRTFGDVFAYKCRIDHIDGALIIPLRTHHGPEILELIAPVHIKKALNKKEGDEVRIEVI